MTTVPENCKWCGNRLVNEHPRCAQEAAPAVEFETRHGHARARWGAWSKRYDYEWYGYPDGIESRGA